MSFYRKRLLPPLLPILAVEDRVLLPGSSMVLQVTDLRGMNLVEKYLWNDSSWVEKYVGVVPRDASTDKLHSIGVAASVSRITHRSYPQSNFTLQLVGLCRLRVEDVSQEFPYLVASVTQLDHLSTKDDPLPAELDELAEEFRSNAQRLLQLLQSFTPSAGKLRRLLDSLPVQTLPDLLTSLVRTSFSEKLEILSAVDIQDRFRLAQPLLLRQIETLRLLTNASQSDPKMNERSRKLLIPLKRGQLPIEGGTMMEGGEEEDDIAELQQKIVSAKLPTHAQKAAEKELKRLKSLPSYFPEHSVSRTYLETLLDLPWSQETSDLLNVSKARQDLDADHYGMEKVKKRIVEFLAVRQLKNSLKGPILCLVGAPGVGKTSIGRSVALTMGRKFHRISLGGISDQSDIRGHRRTYIGSMPGRILQGLRTAGVNNPVFLLDEVDKLSKGLHGDPAAGLLEVLDPEQNNTFTDHYLGIPFDLSRVLFIATANSMSTIHPPLLDRMEVIEVPGYTVEEKVQIAVRHLLPKLLEQHGLTANQLNIPSSIIQAVVSDYTREAGVRNLEKNISALCRAIAVQIAEDGQKKNLPITLTPASLTDVLGPKRYEHEVSERLTVPGVAVGLAWTPAGGDILFVEASKMPGEGRVVLTGQLGKVMKESAKLALSWLRSHAANYGLDCSNLDKTDIHVHFPAGAVEKDGPSAGVTIATVLTSLFAGRLVRSDTAMTGEITLRGNVLPVGGIKEKLLAAHRAGITHVIIPRRNEKDLMEVPVSVKDSMKITSVQSVEEVLSNAFDGGITPSSKL